MHLWQQFKPRVFLDLMRQTLHDWRIFCCFPLRLGPFEWGLLVKTFDRVQIRALVGRSRTSMSSSLCFGSSSCWEVNFRPSLRSWVLWNKFSLIDLFSFPSTKTSQAQFLLRKHSPQHDAAPTMFLKKFDILNLGQTSWSCSSQSESPSKLIYSALNNRSVENLEGSRNILFSWDWCLTNIPVWALQIVPLASCFLFSCQLGGLLMFIKFSSPQVDDSRCVEISYQGSRELRRAWDQFKVLFQKV